MKMEALGSVVAEFGGEDPEVNIIREDGTELSVEGSADDSDWKTTWVEGDEWTGEVNLTAEDLAGLAGDFKVEITGSQDMSGMSVSPDSKGGAGYIYHLFQPWFGKDEYGGISGIAPESRGGDSVPRLNGKIRIGAGPYATEAEPTHSTGEVKLKVERLTYGDTDPSTATSGTEFKTIRDVSLQQNSTGLGNSIFDTRWNTRSDSEGTYRLSSRGFDKAGEQVNDTRQRTVIVDNWRPYLQEVHIMQGDTEVTDTKIIEVLTGAQPDTALVPVYKATWRETTNSSGDTVLRLQKRKEYMRHQSVAGHTGDIVVEMTFNEPMLSLDTVALESVFLN